MVSYLFNQDVAVDFSTLTIQAASERAERRLGLCAEAALSEDELVERGTARRQVVDAILEDAEDFPTSTRRWHWVDRRGTEWPL